MAYMGYDPDARAAARQKALDKAPGRGLPPVAWARLLAVAASLAAWVGIIAVARAVFF
ncbi:hypothetical protein [Caulobacter sp. Root655]|uniref:hypothetical protein n=1 Tax=Caulobacter sp. Root655 TaxID=1736578 RepID=UPI000A90A3A4|nr:hypothetical protein [Caulobacter sp. Root655]